MFSLTFQKKKMGIIILFMVVFNLILMQLKAPHALQRSDINFSKFKMLDQIYTIKLDYNANKPTHG